MSELTVCERYVRFVKKETDRSHAQHYYQTSDQELAQRYIKGKTFLSREYCEAALEHRYELYPFIHELVPFASWAGKRVLEVGCGQGADLSEFAAAGAAGLRRRSDVEALPDYP